MQPPELSLKLALERVQPSDPPAPSRSHSYTSVCPFLSCGRSASCVWKNTRLPSSERLRVRNALRSGAAVIDRLPARYASPAAGAPLGSHDTHASLPFAAL